MYISSALIFPSHREGFPNALLESGAMQLPIICSEIRGNIDLIDNNKGYLFKKGSKHEIAKKIDYFFNSKLKHAKEKNLHNHIKKHFERNVFHQKMLNFYNNL